MSGECGYNGSKYIVGLSRGMSEELVKSASLTLGRLNSMIKKMSDWREERLILESNVNRLKCALKKSGKNPDEALIPDPLVVNQRSEIHRLELRNERLEEDVKGLREALRESDQAITCHGAKILKDKMAKLREDKIHESRILKDEIRHLKIRVKETEENISCSSFIKLRMKLREILEGDKKIERIIADVASRSSETVVDLLNELEKIRDTLDKSNLENIRINEDKTRLENDIRESVKKSHSHSFRVKELEGEIKELGNQLNKSLEEFQCQEEILNSIKNENLGIKIAYDNKMREIDMIHEFENDYHIIKENLKLRDQFVEDLQQQIEISSHKIQDIERLKNELITAKSELLNLEIEKNGLVEDIERFEIIISERNDHIVKILEDKESLETRCGNLDIEISKLKNISEASGDRDPKNKFNDFKEELEKLNTENINLKNVIGKLNAENSELFNKLEKTIDSEENKEYKNEEIQAEDGLRKKLCDLEANNSFVKLDFEKMRDERNALKNELKKLSLSRNELSTELDKSKIKYLELEEANIGLNEKLKGYNSLIEKLGKLEEEFSEALLREANLAKEIKSEVDNLRAENEDLKAKFDKEKHDKEELANDLRITKSELEKSIALEIGKNEMKNKLRKDIETETDIKSSFIINCDDYLRADRELKYYIQLQSLAVKRLVNFISYIEGTITLRPTMAKYLEPTTTEIMILNFDKNLTQTFIMSQKLSENIFKAEINIQKIEYIKYEKNNLRKECDSLNNGIGKLSKIQNLQKCGHSKIHYEPGRNAENEIEFLSEERNEIPEEDLPGSIKNHNSEKGVYEIYIQNSDRRISDLQNQIDCRRREAGRRIIEIRETMRQERMKLIEIAENENIPYYHYYT